MIDPFKLIRSLGRRRAAINNALLGAPDHAAGPDEIAVIDSPSIGPDRLSPDLLPEQVWGSNLRGLLPRRDWDRLRIPVCERAGNRCEICGSAVRESATGRLRRPDCHELWSFEIHGDRFVQRLVGLIALDPDCHRVQHIGLASARGELDLVRIQLAKVNGWRPFEVQAAMDRAFDAYRGRLGFAWDLDLTLLQGQVQVPGFPGLVIPAGLREQLGNSFRI